VQKGINTKRTCGKGGKTFLAACATWMVDRILLLFFHCGCFHLTI
jgi:hypothetical protein